tara:strand:- start:994 stop:1110 length:117 start_codon:yes stop_codon:yes gene_type:complete
MRQVNTIFTVYMLFFFYLTVHPSKEGGLHASTKTEAFE